MIPLPASQRIRHAASRIAARTPIGANPVEEMQVISETLDLLALADDVEVMEERLRPRSPRERSAARLSRRLSRRLCAVARRLLDPAAVAAG